MSVSPDCDMARSGEIPPAPGEIVDLRADRRLALHHRLEKWLWGPMKSRGVPGPGLSRRLAQRLVPLPRVQGSAIIPTNLGFALKVEPVADRILGLHLLGRGTYEPGTLAVMKELLEKGGTMVDVGANIGLMSLAASMRVGPSGHVIAVEPVPDTHEALRYNVALNGARNVTTCLLALGAAPRSTVIYERPELGKVGASLLRGPGSGRSHVVFVETLDALLDKLDVPSVDVLKVDVEGWESEVLKGGVRLLSGATAPAVIIECSSLQPGGRDRAIEVFTRLTGLADHRVFRLAKGKEVPSRLVEVRSARDLPAHDNLFCLRPAHLQRLPARFRP